MIDLNANAVCIGRRAIEQAIRYLVSTAIRPRVAGSHKSKLGKLQSRLPTHGPVKLFNWDVYMRVVRLQTRECGLNVLFILGDARGLPPKVNSPCRGPRLNYAYESRRD